MDSSFTPIEQMLKFRASRHEEVRSTPVAVSTAREISLAPVNKLIDDIVKANAG